MKELIVDVFAGGGGASTGIFWATGRHPDIAIDHAKKALHAHELNHTKTKHYLSDVWEVDPIEACGGRPVGLAWFSPDCTQFSRSKVEGNLNPASRNLAWVIVDWAKSVKPRVIILENVEEFKNWGPLNEEGRPDRQRRGETFSEWCSALSNLGYKMEFRVLHAHHYGVPTYRKRLFMVARCDGQPIKWPQQTHSDEPSEGLLPYRTLRECIDWSIKGNPIEREGRQLSDSTMKKITEGREQHGSQFVILYYSRERGGASLDAPCRTVTTVDTFAFINGDTIRMFTPDEYAKIQGFPKGYQLGPYNRRDRNKIVGNSVCPPLAQALVESNYKEKS